MNEVRSTNELACCEAVGLEVRQMIVLLQEVKETEQASLMGYVMHTLHDAYSGD
jgi:hypothetical protein